MNFLTKFKIIHFLLFLTLVTCQQAFSIDIHYFPPDTVNPDTVRPQKIVYQYDTLIVIDTIIQYDTVYRNSNLKFSTEIYLSPFLVNSKLSVLNDEQNFYLQLKQDAENYQMSYLFGASGNIRLNNISASIGLSYSTIRQKADYNFVNITLTDRSYYNFVDNSYWSTFVVDSFYQLNPDTIWIVVIDSTYNQITDSVFINKYDTSITNQAYNDINTYKYFEIPLIFAYTISEIGRFSFDIKSGLIAGLLISTKGETVYPNNEDLIVEVSNPPLVKTSFHILMSTRINYSLTKHYNIFAEPYYRKTLKSIYEKNYLIKEKQDFLGFKMGIEYFF